MKQKNIITVVTDHQITADTIARAIGANEKHEGYYLGNGYAVTWTGGQLIEAEFSPLECFVLSTNMDCRLVYAHNFDFSMRNYDDLVGYPKSVVDSRQLATIRQLWTMSCLVVNAMNPDFEGETDFLNLYYFIGCPVEVRRAWLPILTKGAIRHGVMHGPANRKDYETWLNESIYNLLVEKSKSTAPRVPQTEVEELPVEMKPMILASLGIADKNDPPATDGDATFAGDMIYLYREKATLFNLPALLVEAAVELDFTPEKTIEKAMVLYSKKLISYPMTRQNTIPTGVWKLMHTNIEILRHNTKWGHTIKEGRPNRLHNFTFENPYMGHGIVTTGLHPTDLSREEEALYNIIVKRVIDALEPSVPRRRKGAKASRRKASKVKTA